MGSNQDVSLRVVAKDESSAAFQSVLKNVSAVESQVSKLSGNLSSLKGELAGVSTSDWAKNLASQAVIAQQATDKLANNMHTGFGRSTQTLQDMGRIIQDMPYGIMGIGNNIQPLVESFGRLKAETGSAGGAIQALIAGIGGPAGLAMIGIPIVTSLAIVFAGPLMKAIAGAGESVDELKARLAGLAQYENLTLKVAMSGVEGAKRDLISLIGLQERLRIMQYESGLGKALKDASALPNAQHTYGTTGRYFAGGIGGDPVMQGAQANAKDLAVAKAKADIKNYEYETAQRIWKGEISFGTEDNLRRLNAINIDETAALKHLAILKATSDVAEAQNKSDASATKEKEAFLKKNLAAAKSGSFASAKDDSSAQKAQERAVAEWEVIYKRTGKLLEKNTESAIGYAEAHQGVSDAEEALAKIREMGLGYTDFTLDAEDKLVEARNLEGKAIDTLARKSKDLSKVFKGVGDMAVLFGLSGSGVTGMLEGVNSLSANNMAKSVKDIQSANPDMTPDQARQQASAQAYAGIAQSLGSVIGGKTGNAISATASGALTGFSVGGPIGAAIGGVIGLAGSLFGGDSGKEQRKADRKSTYDSIVQSALSGGAYSASILKSGGYSYQGVANSTIYNPTKTAGAQGRLLEDSRGQELTNLQTAIGLLDAAAASIAGVMKPSILTTLEGIQTKFDYAVATVGNLAELEIARIMDITTALTGFSVDSLSSVLDSIVTTTKAEDVGAAFSAKITEALSASIRQMQVGTFMQTLIAPVLQPLYANIAQSMAAGTDTSAGFAAIKMALKDLTPQINAFAQSLADQGITVDAATVAITNLNTALSNTVSISNSIKSAFKDQYDYAKNILELQKTTYSELADKLKALSSGLNSALESLHPAGSSKEDQTAARVALQSALSGARSTGTLPINGEITSALAVASRMTSASYSNATEYARDLYSTLSTISELDKITGNQLTIAEQQVSWLEKISATLDRSYENTNTAYDKYLAAAKAQVDGLNGIGLSSTVTNKTLAAATEEAAKTLKTQMGGFADLVTGIGSVDTGVGTVKDVMSSIELNQATYEASLRQVAGIYDVNASVSAVNLSIIAMTDSVSQYLSIQAQNKAAEDAAAAKAADENAKAKLLAAAAAARDSSAVRLSQHYDQSGQQVTLGVGQYSDITNQTGFANDSVSSLLLQPGYKIVLYKDSGFAGDSYTATNTSNAASAISEGGAFRNDRYSSAIVSRLPGYATGGIASGPASGYPVTMHGTEAIIPMGKGSLPLVIDFSDMIAELQALRGEVGNMKTEMVRRSDVIAQNTGRTKNAIELQNVAAGIAG